MAHIIDVHTVTDDRGSLSVIDKILPFDIKRVYYIYGLKDLARGGHRHKETTQALIAVNGRCSVLSNDGVAEETFLLTSPSQALILEPKDWHTMSNFAEGTVLLALVSTHYDADDYIHEGY